ncbi:DUF637 domain-containing protein, partial [Halopseudomonas pertucinogena]|uniref:DUF637 domain-containing protein n=1 Tax=Halopseudomonas pertucinogena TaxID=86175 RepID=UPI00166F3574
QGELAIKAVEGLQIDIKHIDQHTVSQTIDAMVQADPNLAWLKEMESRGDVDWQRVKEVHDSFSYSSSGLSGPAAMVVAIVVAYFTAGAGAALTGATSTAGVAASNAVGAAVASNTAVSTINNRGDLGDVLSDVTASDAMKGYAVAGITAGLTAGVYDNWTGTQTGTSNTGAVSNNTGVLANSGNVSGAGLNSWSGAGQFAGNQALQNSTSALLNKALGQEGSLGDALTSTLANTFAAAGFNWVGDVSQGQYDNGSLPKIGLHAIMGGLAAEAAGGDFRTGALVVAGANEALIDSLAQQYGDMDPAQRSGLLTMNSQVLGVLVASVAGGDEQDMQTGAWVAGNATQYNHDLHEARAQNFADGVLDACARRPDICMAGADGVTSEELVGALRVIAAHGEGASSVNPQAIELAEQFLGMFSGTSDTLFTPTESEQQRIDVVDTVELIGTGVGLAGAARSVLTQGVGKAGSWFAGLVGGGAKGVSDPASLANAAKLRGKLAGQEISGGHAFEKHVIQRGEYKDIGITTRDQFASHIESVVNNPSSFRQLGGGRTAYWDDVSGTVVIRNPKAVDGGTAFRPTNGKAYFEGLR